MSSKLLLATEPFSSATSSTNVTRMEVVLFVAGGAITVALVIFFSVLIYRISRSSNNQDPPGENS
jgi:hypothetical protein